MAVCAAAESPDAEACAAASLVDADWLLAGAAHAANIVMQQHNAISPVSIRFMKVPLSYAHCQEKADAPVEQC